MELYELKNMIVDCTALAIEQYEKTVSPGKDSISQREAFRAYGEARVRAWLRSGLVRNTRTGTTSRTKIIYSKAELRAAENAERLSCIMHKPRI